jgi:hypothetical protein
MLMLWGLAVAACAGESPTQPRRASLDQPFELQPGQTALVGNEDLRVTFEKVSEDSRCPTGATCVWEGDAAAKLTVVQGTQEKSSLELHTSRRFSTEARYLRYRVVLEAVAPHPKLGTPIEAPSYRVTLTVKAAP